MGQIEVRDARSGSNGVRHVWTHAAGVNVSSHFTANTAQHGIGRHSLEKPLSVMLHWLKHSFLSLGHEYNA